MSQQVIRKIRIEMEKGMFALTKVIDVETGRLIPARSVELKMNTKDMSRGGAIYAKIEVPIDELFIDGVKAEIVGVKR